MTSILTAFKSFMGFRDARNVESEFTDLSALSSPSLGESDKRSFSSALYVIITSRFRLPIQIMLVFSCTIFY